MKQYVIKLTWILFDVILVISSFVFSSILINQNQYMVYLKAGFIEYYLISSMLIATFFILFKIYRDAWAFASVKEYKSLLLASLAAYCIAFLVATIFKINIPVNLFIIATLLGTSLVTGFRFLVRAISEKSYSKSANAKRVLIIGAGNLGAEIVKDIKNNPNYNYNPVGFLDDDPEKKGQIIHNVEVVGKIKDLEKIVNKYSVQEAILTIAKRSGNLVKEISEKCKNLEIDFKIVPSIHELISDKIKFAQVRKVNFEDLLERKPNKLNITRIAQYITKKTVLVTGAGGSIGSELCRQICQFKPSLILLLGKGENSIYEIQKELEDNFSKVKTFPVICDVKDKLKIENILLKFKPEIIFHAAAHKHVPLMELNPSEAIKNNVIGTQVLAQAAVLHNVKRFVLISTDKAINPVNFMGASKRICELIVQEINRNAKINNKETTLCAVRFGNVLGSRGSVIPRFKKEMELGGPVTITDPNMTRYFMTIPEASQLVIEAGALAKGGEIFALDMGKPIKIIHIAEELIRLSGFEPYKDMNIRIIGKRPGEKMHEGLMGIENATATENEKVFVANVQDGTRGTRLWYELRNLEKKAISNDTLGMLKTIKKIIPEFRHQNWKSPKKIEL